jgi:hypothetical protein
MRRLLNSAYRRSAFLFSSFVAWVERSETQGAAYEASNSLPGFRYGRHDRDFAGPTTGAV